MSQDQDPLVEEGDSGGDLFLTQSQLGEDLNQDEGHRSSSSQPLEENKEGLVDESGEGFIPVATKRPRVCNSRWRGKECTREDCSFAHPAYCANPACKEKSLPGCKLWHPKSKMPASRQGRGNARRGGASSSFNPKGSNTRRKDSVQSLKLKLANTQIALMRAQKSASSSQGNNHAAGAASQCPSSQGNTYAAVAARKRGGLCPTSTQEAATPHLMRQEVDTSAQDDIRAQVAMLAEQLGALVARLRI